jgi:hypothetical protein
VLPGAHTKRGDARAYMCFMVAPEQYAKRRLFFVPDRSASGVTHLLQQHIIGHSHPVFMFSLLPKKHAWCVLSDTLYICILKCFGKICVSSFFTVHAQPV